MPKPKPLPVLPFATASASWTAEEVMEVYEKLRRRIEIKELIDSLQKEQDEELKPYLLTLFAAKGVRGFQVEDRRIMARKGRAPSRIDAALLVENGISVEVIEASTVAGVEYETIEVRSVKEKDKED